MKQWKKRPKGIQIITHCIYDPLTLKGLTEFNHTHEELNSCDMCSQWCLWSCWKICFRRLDPLDVSVTPSLDVSLVALGGDGGGAAVCHCWTKGLILVQLVLEVSRLEQIWRQYLHYSFPDLFQSRWQHTSLLVFEGSMEPLLADQSSIGEPFCPDPGITDQPTAAGRGRAFGFGCLSTHGLSHSSIIMALFQLFSCQKCIIILSW